MRNLHEQDVSSEGHEYEEGQYVEVDANIPGEANRQMTMQYFASMGSAEEAMAAIQQLFRDMEASSNQRRESVPAAEGGEKGQNQSPTQADTFGSAERSGTDGEAGASAGSDLASL